MAMQQTAAKKVDRKAQIEPGKKEVKEQAKKAVLTETAKKPGGLEAQRAALKPPVPPSPQRPLDPKKDPSKNPDTESEHVKGATYDVVKGTAFIQGKGDDKDIDPNDVSQGRLGDCYFVAALAAIACSSSSCMMRACTSAASGGPLST